MARSVVVDSSALVALLHRRDQHHAWAAKQAAALSQPWWTCEAAGSEAFFLLGAHGREPLLQLIARGALCIVASSSAEPNLIVALMRRYGNVPMSLADACLVRLSESLPDPVIVTTDSDFRIYRRFGRQAIPLLMPDRSLPRLLFSQHPDQPGHGPDRVFRRQRVLPDANHSPQFLPQQPRLCAVACTISLDLRAPKRGVIFRPGGVLRAAVEKAAVDEHGDAVRRKHKVGTDGDEVTSVE
jgi:predicted nucleic acid-binding protein